MQFLIWVDPQRHTRAAARPVRRGSGRLGNGECCCEHGARIGAPGERLPGGGQRLARLDPPAGKAPGSGVRRIATAHQKHRVAADHHGKHGGDRRRHGTRPPVARVIASAAARTRAPVSASGCRATRTTGPEIDTPATASRNSLKIGAAMQRIVGGTRGGHVFERDLAAVSQRSIDAELSLALERRVSAELAALLGETADDQPTAGGTPNGEAADGTPNGGTTADG